MQKKKCECYLFALQIAIFSVASHAPLFETLAYGGFRPGTAFQSRPGTAAHPMAQEKMTQERWQGFSPQQKGTWANDSAHKAWKRTERGNLYLGRGLKPQKPAKGLLGTNPLKYKAEHEAYKVQKQGMLEGGSKAIQKSMDDKWPSERPRHSTGAHP